MLDKPWRQQTLDAVDFGKSVAEQDENLDSYYVDIQVYDEVVADRIDIVRGQKGAGKSAILRRMMSKGIPGVRLKTAVNLQGEQAFRRVFALAFEEPDKIRTEQMLADAWKLYFLSVVVDELSDVLKGWPNPFKRGWFYIKHLRPLKAQLNKYSLTINSRDLEAKFRFAVSRVGFVFKDPAGNSVDPYLDFKSQAKPGVEAIPFNQMYERVVAILQEVDCSIWVCLDKLDEAFQNLDKPIEHMALRSLLAAYKDVMHHERIRVKIFIREDIFGRVTHSGFTALTHIRTRASAPITWDKERLLHLVVERLQYPEAVKALLKGAGFSLASSTAARSRLLTELFPPQVDKGRESDTFTWIVNRVKDGTGVSTPRDVIDLLTYAKVKQQSQWAINPPVTSSHVIFEPQAFKDALEVLSADKLNAHLFAEHPHLRPAVEKLRDKKTEYDAASLKVILGEDHRFLKELVEVGFFEPKQKKSGPTWWVPFIYRDGLDIRQGKFVGGVEIEESETDSDE